MKARSGRQRQLLATRIMGSRYGHLVGTDFAGFLERAKSAIVVTATAQAQEILARELSPTSIIHDVVHPDNWPFSPGHPWCSIATVLNCDRS
jgi:hypothetical protein